MKRYNVGIVGYGWAARAHIAAIQAGSRAPVSRLRSFRKSSDAALSSAVQRRPLRLDEIKAA